MRVRTHLRTIRKAHGLSIGDVCQVTGIARGDISMFERGHSVPYDAQLPVMIGVYGPMDGWYPASVLAVLMPELRDCPGCGEELDPDASRRRRYHDERCRSEARRTSLAARRQEAEDRAAPDT